MLPIRYALYDYVHGISSSHVYWFMREMIEDQQQCLKFGKSNIVLMEN